MFKQASLKTLIQLADSLDSKGLTEEANTIDGIIKEAWVFDEIQDKLGKTPDLGSDEGWAEAAKAMGMTVEELKRKRRQEHEVQNLPLKEQVENPMWQQQTKSLHY